VSKKNNTNRAVIIVLIVIFVLGIAGLLIGRQISKMSQIKNERKSTNGLESITNSNVDQDVKGYMKIKEWGIKIPITDDVNGLKYTIKSEVVSIRSKSLDKTSGNCTSNSINVARGKASDIVPDESGKGKNNFLDTYNKTNFSVDYPDIRSVKAKIGSYYFVVPEYESQSCIATGSQSTEDLVKKWAETRAEFGIVKAINKMTKL
jgi:hypothetical protein